MLEVKLNYRSDHVDTEVILEGDRISLGRGGDAQIRPQDDGLSRLHATVFREGDKIWVVDENSTNGTFVNGEKVNPGGTPLYDGDTIRIGHQTDVRVSISEAAAAKAVPEADVNAPPPEAVPAPSESSGPSIVIPLVVTGLALIVVFGAAIFIGITFFGGGDDQTVQSRERFDDDDYDDRPEKEDEAGNETVSDANSNQNADTNQAEDNSQTASTPVIEEDEPTPLPPGKRYQSLSNDEKDQYIKNKAEKVARIIGNNSGESIPPEAIVKIRGFLEAYASRVGRTRNNDCSGRGWLKSDMVSILERARANAPFIIRAYNQNGIDPQVGLYLAMIESEHCECLQSYTGPLGMYQFTYATAKRFGLDVKRDASPTNKDQRCEPEPAARASAAYMKSLTSRIGTGALSYPLAIASYNSGEGGLGKNLKIALESKESESRSFWTLVANAEKLAEQFQRENIKYVPKFFAAAIIGENPRDFGVDLHKLSSYSR